MSKARPLPPDDWLTQSWEETTDGVELWLSAKNNTFDEAYQKLREQFSVKNMPLNIIELAWIKYGYEEDDCDREGEQMYWRGSYRRGSYPIWCIDSPPSIEKYGGVL